MNSPYIQWTSAKKDEPFDSNNLVLPFISLAEHNHLLSQLEERLRAAESYFKIIDDHTAEYSGVAGNQVLFETVKAALAAIKEKK